MRWKLGIQFPETLRPFSRHKVGKLITPHTSTSVERETFQCYHWGRVSLGWCLVGEPQGTKVSCRSLRKESLIFDSIIEFWFISGFNLWFNHWLLIHFFFHNLCWKWRQLAKNTTWISMFWFTWNTFSQKKSKCRDKVKMKSKFDLGTAVIMISTFSMKNFSSWDEIWLHTHGIELTGNQGIWVHVVEGANAKTEFNSAIKNKTGNSTVEMDVLISCVYA